MEKSSKVSNSDVSNRNEWCMMLFFYLTLQHHMWYLFPSAYAGLTPTGVAMLTRLESGQSYAGRPAGVVPVNFSLTRDAALILDHLAPSRRAKGHFLSRLLCEYAAMQTEREKWLQKVTAMLGEEDKHTS